MRFDLRARTLAASVALGATVAIATAGAGAAAPGPTAGDAAIKNCTEAKNIEAIIDDSGSMAGTDPSRLRASLMDILVGLPENKGKQLGAVEFATEAGPLFAPLAIGSSSAQAAVAPALALIDANGSGVGGDFGDSTNYNAGFTAGNAANPSADARVFLSDGQPNEGGAPVAHQSPPTKTYVVGFDAAVTGGTVLGQIATETAGVAYAVNTAAEILPIAGQITGALNCQRVRTFTAQFNNQGQSKRHNFKATGKSAQILVTWPTELTNIAMSVNPIGGRKAGTSVATVSAVKGKRSKGSNFTSIRAKGLRKGKKYRIKLKAKALSVPTVVTTQLIK